MTLPVADIDRWSAESVREVFHAANARGQTTLDSSRQLGALAVFDGWEGATAEARKHTNAAIRQDLDAHGNESLVVARAASKAADSIEQVQSKLRTLRRDATELQMNIDPLSNRVRPSATFDGPPTAALIAEMQLQPRLDAIMAEANAIDAELATAIDMADGDAPIPPGPHDNRPTIQASLSEPVPDDPKQFYEFWNRLTPEEKDWLYRQDHNIGNRAGMPWEPTDHLGKDHYNRLHLRELEQRAGYRAVQADLDRADGLRRFLGFLDNTGHAAVAVGNPDHARRNVIFVPGTGQDLARLPFSDARAVAMYNAARNADKTLGAKDVSITTWMGYDRPMDLSQAAFPDPARSGAGGLEAFESGLRASHVGPRSLDTIIGHSYGSTVVGAAASGGHHLDADNVIAVGSPGMLVDRVGGLSLHPGAHVYAMRATHDIIGISGVLGEWTLGPDPTAPHFGARGLAADPGPAGPVGMPSVAAHSGYWDQQNIALANMGAVIAGLAPQ